MLSALLSSGVMNVWKVSSTWRSLRVARSRARRKKQDKKIPAEEKQTASPFLLELLLIGGIAAVVTFIIEVAVCLSVIDTLIEKITLSKANEVKVLLKQDQSV